MVGGTEVQSPGSSAKQRWLLTDLYFPLASVPALPHHQTLQVLEHLSCRTVFFHQDWKVFHCITSAWLVSESLHTDSEMVNQPVQDILITEKPDLDDENLPVLQAVEHQVLGGNHEAT